MQRRRGHLLICVAVADLLLQKGFNAPFRVTPELSASQPFVAVQDEQTKLYQFQQPGEEGFFVVLSGSVFGLNGDVDYSDRTEGYGYLFPFGGNACGTYPDSPHPAGGSTECESYVWGIKGDQQSLKDNTFNVTMQWYNPGASSSQEYSWIIDSQYQYLGAAGDPKSAKTHFGSPSQVYFRYPIPLPD